MTIGPNILFDPSTEELAVADAVLALSLREDSNSNSNPDHPRLHPIALRTIDPPSRLTAPGVSHAAHATAPTTTTTADVLAARETDAGFTTWRPPRGGLDRALVPRILKAVVGAGGVGWEVLEGLRGVEV
jgi:exosome complex component RRP42